MGASAVPVKLTVCGLPLALSVMTAVPVRVPEPEGVKFTYMVQVEPAATPFPQLLVCAKSPLVAILAMCTGAVPELVSTIVCDPLVVPTCWFPKLKLVGESETAGVRAI